MARQSLPLEFNKFIAGLITDANPLTFPENASVDEQNFVLNIDGSRRRRTGMDYEPSHVEITTTITNATSTEPGVSSFKWDNAGGDATKSLLVIQVGNELKFFDLDTVPISNGLIDTETIGTADATVTFSYAVVDSILVVATGEKTPRTYTFTSPSTITASTRTLQVRDFFNVEDVISVDLYDNLNIRPASLTDAHTYNLRNSTWALPRPQGSTEAIDDPITFFHTTSTTKYPSNSDNMNDAFYADPSDTGGPTLERFFAADLLANQAGNTRAPNGFFIIDALDRGASRVAQAASNVSQNPTLDFTVTTLPADTTPGGPSCLAEFAGRAWFGGFSGKVTSGDKFSPHMSSYLLFSRLVRTVIDVGRCYQEADPTAPNDNALVATDGGYVRINDAFDIQALVNVGTSLIILARNGIWRLYGGNNYGFDATNYVVERLSNHGITSVNSVVVVDNTVMFWGQDGIYHIHPSDGGAWISENITFGVIQTLYQAIPTADKQKVKGIYDSFERKVRWIYYNRTADTTEPKELVLDVNLKAYYLNAIKQFTGSAIPRLLTPFKVKPFTINNQVKEVYYLAATRLTSFLKYTFSLYTNTNFRDWYSFDSVGVDAYAYVVTGWTASVIQGYSVKKDFMREKQVPYLFVHCDRTETGFHYDVDGITLLPTNPSSCMVQARWDWSDSSNSNRWGHAFQAYRYKQLYIPLNVFDTFDTGYATIVTKNKLRGIGKVLSIQFATEPNKDLHLYGWSLQLVSNNIT